MQVAMTQRQLIELELYRQAWEASRHPWTLLLSFTRLYVFVGVAVIAYLVQTQSDEAFPYLLFPLSGFALIGILWTLRTSHISEQWQLVQTRIQHSQGIGDQVDDLHVPGGDRKWYRKMLNVGSWLPDLHKKGIGFKPAYLGIYWVSFLVTAVAGFLFLFDVFNLPQSTPPNLAEHIAAPRSPSTSFNLIADASEILILNNPDCQTKSYCDALRDEVDPISWTGLVQN